MDNSNKGAVGALVISADVAGLGIVRSLGRHAIPTWVVDEHIGVAGFSRYCRHRVFDWPEAEDQQIAFLLQIGRRHGLNGWVVFATGDELTASLARHRNVLSAQYRVAVSDWESMRWGYDKRLTYQVAQDLGIDCPTTLYPNNREELGAFAGEFPVILKPAFKRRPNDFTRDKAWLARDRDELLRRYDDAIKLVDPSAVVVQEVISGGGETQFSYAGLFEAGIPLASVAVRRSRQYPVDFGTGTLVETIESSDMEQTAERLLRHIKYSGVAEIEFKLDPRNGTYKLLDFNPRIWRWHSLAGAAGVDLPYLLWRWMLNEPIAKARARAGVQWVYMRNDIRAVAVEIGRGRLSAPHYLRSLLQISTFAVLAKDDLFPALIDLPLMFFHQTADWWNGLSKVLRPVFRCRGPTPSK